MPGVDVFLPGPRFRARGRKGQHHAVQGTLGPGAPHHAWASGPCVLLACLQIPPKQGSKFQCFEEGDARMWTSHNGNFEQGHFVDCQHESFQVRLRSGPVCTSWLHGTNPLHDGCTTYDCLGDVLRFRFLHIGRTPTFFVLVGYGFPESRSHAFDCPFSGPTSLRCDSRKKATRFSFCLKRFRFLAELEDSPHESGNLHLCADAPALYAHRGSGNSGNGNGMEATFSG